MASYAEELALWPRRVPGSRTETGGRFEERGGGETMGDSEDSGREKPQGSGEPAESPPTVGESQPATASPRGPSTGSPGRLSRPSWWLTWQSALYVLVLGAICLVLAPLTSLWIVPILRAAAPIRTA